MRERLTDGSSLSATRGPMVGDVGPETAVGGPLAALRDGDVARIDVDSRTVAGENVGIAARPEDWLPPEPHYRNGVVALCAMLVGSALERAITPTVSRT